MQVFSAADEVVSDFVSIQKCPKCSRLQRISVKSTTEIIATSSRYH